MKFKLRQLKELCDLKVIRADPSNKPDNEFWYIDISSIDNVAKTIATPTLTKGKLASVRARQVVHKNDVLVSTTRPNLNAVALVPKKFHEQICSTGFSVLRCGPDLDPEYLFYFVRSWNFVESLSALVQGALYPAITDKQVFVQLIPWVPIDQQNQIAARLKDQLAEVGKARQAAEAQLRAAKVLNIAISREVFERHSAKWPTIKLGDAGDVAAGITLGGKTNGKQTRQVQYLRVANVKDGSLDLTDVKTIEATYAEIEKLKLRQGDILLTEGGDPDKLGRGTFWQEEIEECIHQNHIFRVRFPSDKYLPEFVAAQIGSTYGKDYFLAHAKKTTGIATINQQVLKAFPLLTPDLGTQKTVMLELSVRLQEAHAIIEAARKQVDEISILPQKILAQAFGWQER